MQQGHRSCVVAAHRRWLPPYLLTTECKSSAQFLKLVDLQTTLLCQQKCASKWHSAKLNPCDSTPQASSLWKCCSSPRVVDRRYGHWQVWPLLVLHTLGWLSVGLTAFPSPRLFIYLRSDELQVLRTSLYVYVTRSLTFLVLVLLQFLSTYLAHPLHLSFGDLVKNNSTNSPILLFFIHPSVSL